MDELIPLHQMSSGQTADVGQIVGPPDDVQRLAELGIKGGAAVEMVQSGTPCIIRLSGRKLCFRHDDVMRVLVRRGVVR